MTTKKKAPKPSETVELNVDVNMTVKIPFKEITPYDDGGGSGIGAAWDAVEDMLNGIEVNIYGGEAWVCSVDDVNFINPSDEDALDKALEEAEDDD
jgi:hypothetical protein